MSSGSAGRFDDEGSRVEDREGSFSIFDPRSSILDLRFSSLDPPSSILDPRFTTLILDFTGFSSGSLAG
jgi:hypothetical protein